MQIHQRRNASRALSSAIVKGHGLLYRESETESDRSHAYIHEGALDNKIGWPGGVWPLFRHTRSLASAAHRFDTVHARTRSNCNAVGGFAIELRSNRCVRFVSDGLSPKRVGKYRRVNASNCVLAACRERTMSSKITPPSLRVLCAGRGSRREDSQLDSLCCDSGIQDFPWRSCGYCALGDC